MKFKNTYFFYCFFALLLINSLFAQTADSYTVPYCKPTITGQSNTRLAGYTYELQSAADFTTDAFETNIPEKVRYASMLTQRLFVTIPVILKPRHTFSIGLNSWQQRYPTPSVSTMAKAGPVSALSTKGLSSFGTQFTYIFSIDAKSLIYAQGMIEQNAVSGFGHLFQDNALKYTGALVYIRKPNKHIMLGAGISRSYRPGRLIYFPIGVVNLSTPNDKWVAEAQIPAKAQVKYNASSKTQIGVGYEMDGHTYTFQEAYSPAANMQLALRRGDNRFRIQVEQQVYKLLWVAVQTGYKQNINFSYDFVQNGKDKPIYVAGAPDFTAKNKLSNQLYFNITLYVAAPK